MPESFLCGGASSDPYVILDFGYARRAPGRPLRLFSLRPGSHVSTEDHLTGTRFHNDLFCVDLCGSMKRPFDRVYDIAGRNVRLYDNQI